jgi:hypothetical protein
VSRVAPQRLADDLRDRRQGRLPDVLRVAEHVGIGGWDTRGGDEVAAAAGLDFREKWPRE